MRDKLIQLLIQNLDSYVSGENISKVYGVTRAAIWKHVQALKEQGCDIVCTPHKGYKLQSMPDSMRPEFILAWLKTKHIGKDIRYYDRIDSTNQKARELAASGCPHGLLVLADEQFNGRGRLGRKWFSPGGSGVFMSVVLRPDLHPSHAQKLVIIGSLAVLRAVRAITGIDVKIKWPNDLVAEGKKVCGIMVEMNAEMDRINWAVMGIGLNVNTTEFPLEIIEQAASLKSITGTAYSRAQMVLTICHELEDLFIQLTENNDFPSIMEEYRESSIVTGKRVRVMQNHKSVEGEAKGFDDEGTLLLMMDDGSTEKIIAGDISLRGISEHV